METIYRADEAALRFVREVRNSFAQLPELEAEVEEMKRRVAELQLAVLQRDMGCDRCGGAVLDRARHDAFHARLGF